LRIKNTFNIINLHSSSLSITISHRRRSFKMFLKNQFFFYRLYFKIMDRMNCIVFTWNPKLEYFEMSQSLLTKRVSHVLIVFHFLYLCVATYVFVAIKMRGQSTMSLAFHLPFLIANWYSLLFRSFYTTKANELVCLFNSAILLEKHHIHSNFTH